MSRARARLAELNEVHCYFHDPRVLGTNDCQLVNGFDSGDVVSARIQSAVYDSGDPSVTPYVDIERLRRIIRENARFTLADR